MKLGSALARLRGSGAGLYFVGALALALTAGFIVTAWMRSAVPTETVWVAARDLPPGTPLEPSDLRSRQVPAGSVPDGALTDPEEVAGRRLRGVLIEGDVVRSRHLAEGEGNLSQRLKELGENYRAVVLPRDLFVAANRLAPGDRLELTAVLPVRSPEANTEVVVWVAGAMVLEVLEDDDLGGGVLVAIDGEEVPRLSLAQQAGTVTVAVTPAGVQPEQKSQQPLLSLEALTRPGEGGETSSVDADNGSSP